MIQTLIELYSAYNIDQLNTELGGNSALVQVQSIKNNEQIHASESNSHYRIVFVNSDQLGSAGQRRFQVRFRIDFFLKLYNQQLSNYRNSVDLYLWGLQRTFLKNDKTAGAYSNKDIPGLTIHNIINIRIISGDRITSDHFNPAIEITLDVFDENI